MCTCTSSPSDASYGTLHRFRSEDPADRRSMSTEAASRPRAVEALPLPLPSEAAFRACCCRSLRWRRGVRLYWPLRAKDGDEDGDVVADGGTVATGDELAGTATHASANETASPFCRGRVEEGSVMVYVLPSLLLSRGVGGASRDLRGRRAGRAGRPATKLQEAGGSGEETASALHEGFGRTDRSESYGRLRPSGFRLRRRRAEGVRRSREGRGRRGWRGRWCAAGLVDRVGGRGAG